MLTWRRTHQLAAKQLHKLVAQQSRAHKELNAIRKTRSQFVREWTSYLEQLTTLLEKQLHQKAEAMASLATAETGWQEQLASASKAIRQQMAAGTQTIPGSSDEEQEAMEAEVDADAAAEAQRQLVVEHSQQQEKSLLSALQSAAQAAEAQAQQYRERTPRRQRESDAKKEASMDDAKGGQPQVPPGAAQ